MATNQSLVTIIRDRTEIPLPKEPSSYRSTTSTMIDSGTSVSGKLLTLNSLIRRSGVSVK